MTKSLGNVLNARAMKLNPNEKEMVLELANRTRAIGKEWLKGGYHDSQCGFSMTMLADWMRYAVGEKMFWELSEEEQAALEKKTQLQLYGTDEPRCLDCGWPLVIKKIPDPGQSDTDWWRTSCFQCKVFAISKSPTMAVDKLRAKMESEEK